MAAPSVTHTFSNGTVADADEVNTNFTDIINGITDGTKDLSISALTCAGSATLNGNVTLGNASGDDITVTGSLASSIPIKTTNTYDIGSAALGLAGIYFGTSDTDTARVVSAALAADATYTIPDAGTTAEFVMTAADQTVAGDKTFTGEVIHSDTVYSEANFMGRIDTDLVPAGQDWTPSYTASAGIYLVMVEVYGSSTALSGGGEVGIITTRGGEYYYIGIGGSAESIVTVDSSTGEINIKGQSTSTRNCYCTITKLGVTSV